MKRKWKELDRKGKERYRMPKDGKERKEILS